MTQIKFVTAAKTDDWAFAAGTPADLELQKAFALKVAAHIYDNHRTVASPEVWAAAVALVNALYLSGIPYNEVNISNVVFYSRADFDNNPDIVETLLQGVPPGATIN